ncbi:hypothetical protein [Alloprevotella sp. Lung230]|uniref:hypothetical protein n=1 Tax=Alloprevotella sp. Lung230 TaxID=2766595 RepID=UPI001654DD1D|nr:hypothetical protein [Alloprevotella sp. Lung230]MBC8625388.1 hypothetical protein [Alloprevotella sp. Lung230]
MADISIIRNFAVKKEQVSFQLSSDIHIHHFYNSAFLVCVAAGIAPFERAGCFCPSLRKTSLSEGQSINQTLNYINQTLNYINQGLVYSLSLEKSSFSLTQRRISKGRMSFGQWRDERKRP